MSKEVPFDLTEEALEAYLEEAVTRAVELHKRVKDGLDIYDSRSKAYYDR